MPTVTFPPVPGGLVITIEPFSDTCVSVCDTRNVIIVMYLCNREAEAVKALDSFPVSVVPTCHLVEGKLQQEQEQERERERKRKREREREREREQEQEQEQEHTCAPHSMRWPAKLPADNLDKRS